MKKVVLIFGFLTQAAFGAEYTGKLVGVCTSESGVFKTYSAQAIETKNGKTFFANYDQSSGQYKVFASTKASCTISAERGGITPF